MASYFTYVWFFPSLYQNASFTYQADLYSLSITIGVVFHRVSTVNNISMNMSWSVRATVRKYQGMSGLQTIKVLEVGSLRSEYQHG